MGAHGQLGLGSMDTLRSQFESLFNGIFMPESQAVSSDFLIGTRPCLYHSAKQLAVLPPSQEATCPWWGSPGRQAGRQAATPPGAPASWHFDIPGSQAGKVWSGIPYRRNGTRALKTPHPQTPTPPLGSLSSLLLLYFRASLLGER